MSGSERLKYCSQCGHHVSNLSLLSATERSALIARAKNERVCGSYFVRLSGEMVTPEAPMSRDEKRSVKQFGVAVLSAAALAVASGCVSQPERKPAPDQGSAKSVPAETRTDASSTGSTGDKAVKNADEEIVLLAGIVFCPEPPARKPGRSGK